MKAVKNGVYETNKMRVEIGKEVVSKIFKPTRNSSLRYNREKNPYNAYLALPISLD